MSADNPVQVYSDNVVVNGQIDEEKVKQIMGKHDNVIAVLQEIYNDNVFIKEYKDLYFVAMPKYPNTDFSKVLQEYCAIKTDNQHATTLYNAFGDIREKNFCAKKSFKDYKEVLSLFSDREYYQSFVNGKYDVVPLSLLFYAKDVDSEYWKRDFTRWYSYTEFTYIMARDYQCYLFFKNVKSKERSLNEAYVRELRSLQSLKDKVIYYTGKGSNLEVTLDFRYDYTRPTKFVFKINGNAHPDKVEDLAAAILIENKKYSYVYRYNGKGSCSYDATKGVLLLLPNSSCDLELEIEKMQDDFPKYDQFSSIDSIVYMSKHDKITLKKVTEYDDYQGSKRKDFNTLLE